VVNAGTNDRGHRRRLGVDVGATSIEKRASVDVQWESLRKRIHTVSVLYLNGEAAVPRMHGIVPTLPKDEHSIYISCFNVNPLILFGLLVLLVLKLDVRKLTECNYALVMWSIGHAEMSSTYRFRPRSRTRAPTTLLCILKHS
jgi:hypothetical protein